MKTNNKQILNKLNKPPVLPVVHALVGLTSHFASFSWPSSNLLSNSADYFFIHDNMLGNSFQAFIQTCRVHSYMLEAKEV